MWLTSRSDSGMSSPYQRIDKNQNKMSASTSNTDKKIDSDLGFLAKLRRDYPSNPIDRVFNY